MTGGAELSDRHRAEVRRLLVRAVEEEVRRSDGVVDGRRLLQQAEGALEEILRPAAEEWAAFRQAEAEGAPRALGERFDRRALAGLAAAALSASLAALLHIAADAGTSSAVTGALLVAGAAVAGFGLQAVVAHLWSRESQAGRLHQPGGVEQKRLDWLTAVEVRGIRPYLQQQRAVTTKTTRLPSAKDQRVPAPRRTSRSAEARTRSVLAHSFQQLPERGHPFIGRRGHLGQITQWVNRDRARVDSRPTVVVLHGPSGAGRTMLARWAAHDMRELFRGACLVDLRGQSVDPLPTRDAILHLMNRLGAPQDQLLFREGTTRGRTALDEGQLSRLVERYHQHLTGLPVVIILDDATDPAQVRTLIPARSESLVLVTAAEPMPLEGVHASVHQLELGPLDAADGEELLRASLGDQRPAEPLPAAGDPVWSRINTLCEGRPLLLRMAGPTLDERTPEALVEDLEAYGPPGTLDAGERTLRMRYRDQPESARRLLRRLALAGRASLGARAAAALLGVGQKEAAGHLDHLNRAGLIRHVRGSRYRLHDLVRRFARARLWDEETAEERAAAQERLIRSYAELADAVIRLVDGNTSTRAGLLPAAAGGHGFPSVDAALRWLDDESSFITATLRHADPAVDRQAVQHLLGALCDYCLLRGDLYRLGELNELTQSIDQGLLTRSVTWRTGVAERQLGELDKAHSTLSRVVGLYQEAHNEAGVGRALRDLGITLHHQGHLREAAEKHREALDLQSTESLPGDRAWTLHALAAVERDRGRVVAASALLAESLELHRASASVHGEAWARLHLGQTMLRRGAVADAEHELRLALELYERSSDVRGQAWSLTQLGTARVCAGDAAAGLEQLRHALARHRDNGDTRGEAWTLYHLGQAQEDNGDRVGAMRTLERARNMFNRMPDRYGVACARHHEARVTRDVRAETSGSLRNSGFARQLLTTARRDYQRAGAIHGEAWTCLELAVIDAGNERAGRALELADEAMRLFTDGYGEGRPDLRGADWAQLLRCTLLPLASPGGAEVGEAVAQEEIAELMREDHPLRDPRLADALDSYALMLGRGQAVEGWTAWRLGMVPTRSACEILGIVT